MTVRQLLLYVAFSITAQTGFASSGLHRFFNTEEFTGLIAGKLQTYEDAALEIDLDSPTGVPIHFDHCKKVLATAEQDINPSQFALFKLLSLNCLAVKRFVNSAAPLKSYFPRKWTPALLMKLPASAVPRVGEDDSAKRAGRSLATYEKRASFAIRKDGSAMMRSTTDEIVYVIMARADFDADGIEDLLVRADWSARHGSGQGFDLFQLSKTSPSAPVRLTWRP